jgi:hypothetical protein
MKQILLALETIEKTAKSGDAAKLTQALEAARQALSGDKDPRSMQLDEELGIWQKKLSVILKEPIGREGMAKHAKHWVEILGKLGAGSSEPGEKK